MAAFSIGRNGWVQRNFRSDFAPSSLSVWAFFFRRSRLICR